ncbi:Calcyphosin-like protein [Nymphon striatum]|nr:Calcyphosin-like protein [Nymphon striatum]
MVGIGRAFTFHFDHDQIGLQNFEPNDMIDHLPYGIMSEYKLVQEHSIMVKLRSQVLKRGSAGIKGIGRVFRIMDDDGGKTLQIEEFYKGLLDYGVTLNETEVKEIFALLDRDGSGNIDYEEFIIALRPPMSQSRIKITLEAYKKMDKTGDGIVTIDDLKGVYNARKHPKYENGELTEAQVFGLFLRNFDSPNDPDGKCLLGIFQDGSGVQTLRQWGIDGNYWLTGGWRMYLYVKEHWTSELHCKVCQGYTGGQAD